MKKQNAKILEDSGNGFVPINTNMCTINYGNQVLNDQHIETHFLGKTGPEIVHLMGRPADEKKEDEWIYVLGKRFFGLYRRRLYLYFTEARVHDYYF
ncbi:hypothetical protein [uncultured Chryseobacterium sp.]|uniref:hypothetical protein n=1 Tax=uncultured Chryseobacterium sp. TaxID=259322 RepID=UPI0025F75286|nr:hypothetical protein [uncultured Chryseobacterium sp.]